MMELTTKLKYIFHNGDLLLQIKAPKENLQVIQDMVKSEKTYTVTIKEYKPKRSLDANGYMWHLINELSNVLRISKDECYLLMLKRYGQRQVIKVVTEGLPILTRAIKYYEIGEERGSCTYITVYTGSSEYDTKEMAILLDGVVSECKEQGIPTETYEEIERLKASWKGGK